MSPCPRDDRACDRPGPLPFHRYLEKLNRSAPEPRPPRTPETAPPRRTAEAGRPRPEQAAPVRAEAVRQIQVERVRTAYEIRRVLGTGSLIDVTV